MVKKIFVSGCSHVQGHGFPDNLNGDIHSKHAWPALIEKDLNYKVVNFSMAGNSADQIVRDFINYDEKESLDAIIVMFPYRVRFLMKNPYGEDENFCPGKLDGSYREKKKFFSSIAFFMTNIKHEEAEEINYLGNIAIFEYFANKLDIPLWVGFTDLPDRLLAEKKLGYENLFNWDTWCVENDFPKLPDNHWGDSAHKSFYQIIKKWLFDQGFDSR